MTENEEVVVLDTEDETITSNGNRNRLCELIDLENNEEDEIVCIGVVDSISHHKGAGTSQNTLNTRKDSIIVSPRKKIFVIDVESDSYNDETPSETTSTKRQPYVVDVEDEINEELEDSNYILKIEDSPRSPKVIDVEDEDMPFEKNQRTYEAMDCYNVEQENNPGVSNSEASGNSHIIQAEVHVESSEAEADCSIDDYDARMREHFRLELNALENEQLESKQIETNTSHDSTEKFNHSNQNFSLNQSAQGSDLNESYPSVCSSDLMECSDDEDVIEIDDGSGDDCVITSPPVRKVKSSPKRLSDKADNSFTTVATIDIEKDEDNNTPTSNRKKITETVGEIFRRMMPSAVPGVISLFAPECHCLPDNVRPLKFCYYYFITSHLVVKEIPKNEFYNMKDQMLVAKKVIHPCTCLSHPLNKNASRITLLTNPQSLFHRSHCYFAINSRHSKKENSADTKKQRRGPRRLSYQVSLHRIPQKREGKDFKDWNDVIIRRRQNASGVPAWSPAAEKENKIHHRPFECKSEPDSWDDGIKIETTDNT